MNLIKGKKYRVKSWDKMVEQYGVNRRGNIKCEHLFVPDMKELCGKIGIYVGNGSIEINGKYNRWRWSSDMLEEIGEISELLNNGKLIHTVN